MSTEDRESLQRAAGIIEGAWYTASGKTQNALEAAIEIINAILSEDEDGDE